MANITHAQTSKITLRGKVIDQATKEPLAFAHIGIPKIGIGTTTSEKGEFEFKVPPNVFEEELTVSYLGYKSYAKKVKYLRNPSTIKLVQTNEGLLEVEVLGPAAVENIIRKAVKRIPKNYPTNGHTNLAFYRESRTKDDSTHIYLAEGVLNVYKKSYKSSKEGQVSLVQGRKINLANPLDTTIQQGFTSGHMAPHRFDFVYNREDFLQEDFFPVYDYWIESMTTYNGKPVYIIGFNKDYNAPDQSEKEEKNVEKGKSERSGWSWSWKSKRPKKITARMKGRIYIEKGSYAIIKGEFEITPEGLKKYNNYPLYSGNWKGNSYVVNYQKLGDKWYFSDAFRKGLYGGGGIYTNEVKITQINPAKSSPLPYLERMSRNQRFTKMTGSYDPDFWANYNTTPMSEGLAASMEQLKNADVARKALDPVYLAELQLRRDSIQYVKRQQEAAKEEKELDFDMGEMKNATIINRRRKKKRKKDFNRFSFHTGLGTHLISSGGQQMGVTLLTDGDPKENIFNISEEMKSRNFEIIGNLGFDIYVRRNLFVRLNTAFDFANSRYKERSAGLGFSMNLSKQRPFFLRAVAEYSNFKYYRKIGIADNDFGKFKIEGEKFKANNIKVNYGSRTHNLKLTAELAIELNPAREFYLRGTYFMPFSRRQDIWMQERKELFRKKTGVEVNDSRVLVTQNDVPFDGQILPDETFSITFGWVFK
jgi:hypothetical protein